MGKRSALVQKKTANSMPRSPCFKQASLQGQRAPEAAWLRSTTTPLTPLGSIIGWAIANLHKNATLLRSRASAALSAWRQTTPKHQKLRFPSRIAKVSSAALQNPNAPWKISSRFTPAVRRQTARVNAWRGCAEAPFFTSLLRVPLNQIEGMHALSGFRTLK